MFKAPFPSLNHASMPNFNVCFAPDTAAWSVRSIDRLEPNFPVRQAAAKVRFASLAACNNQEFCTLGRIIQFENDGCFHQHIPKPKITWEISGYSFIGTLVTAAHQWGRSLSEQILLTSLRSCIDAVVLEKQRAPYEMARPCIPKTSSYFLTVGSNKNRFGALGGNIYEWFRL